VERFDVMASNRPNDLPRRARATYEIVGGQLSVGRSLDGEERLVDILDITEETLLQPGAFAFVGGILAAKARRMIWRNGLEGAYRAESHGIALTMSNETTLMISGRERVVRTYTGDWVVYPDEADDPSTQYWVDHNDMLMRCVVGKLEVMLERYTFRR
jgi:hypothetical protein